MKATRREFLATSATTAVMGAIHARAVNAPSPSGKMPTLRDTGERFTFAIIADPQLGRADDLNRVPANARRTFIQTVSDINAMDPQPAFVLFLGDLVNSWGEKSIANFEECIAPLKAPRLITHGNHDTRPPYTEFRALMQRQCGFDDVFYSFDVGPWHGIALPCNLEGNGAEQVAVEEAMLAWLEQDLAANATRPTIIFEHLHTLPIGTAQTEWYAFRLELRKKLMDLYTRHGNVRWYFNGHVHNGLKVTTKTSWHYKGINFVNCPTIIETRPFGEEFAPFEKGMDEAGFYLLADVRGDTLQLRGRRAGQREEHLYEAPFPTFDDTVEPRWWTPLNAFPAAATLANPSFDAGLKGWRTVHRYRTDEDPGYRAEVAKVDGRNVAMVQTKAKPSAFWANDEYTELYQVIAAPVSPRLRFSYRLENVPQSGGGYVRLAALAGAELRYLMHWCWGHDEAKADYYPRCVGYALFGDQKGWGYLQQLAKERRGFFWRMPDTPAQWHRLEINLADTYEAAIAAPGAHNVLAVDKFVVAFGTWCNREIGNVSAAHFGEVRLDGEAIAKTADRLPMGPEIFEVPFALDLIARQRKDQEKPRKREDQTNPAT